MITQEQLNNLQKKLAENEDKLSPESVKVLKEIIKAAKSENERTPNDN